MTQGREAGLVGPELHSPIFTELPKKMYEWIECLKRKKNRTTGKKEEFNVIFFLIR